MTCKFEECERTAVSKTFGLCGAHRTQIQRGKPLTALREPPPPKLDGETKRAYTNRLARLSHARRMETDSDYAAKKLASSRKWRLENPELMKEFVKSWASRNDRSEYNAAWRKANRDKRNNAGHKWRAAKRGIYSETVIRTQVWIEDNGICGICSLPADPENWHLDHVIPLSRGGQHTRDNVQVSHPFCNLSKKDKLMSELRIRKEVMSE